MVWAADRQRREFREANLISLNGSSSWTNLNPLPHHLSMGLRPQSRPEAEGQTAQALHRPFIKLEGERWEDSRPRLQVKPAGCTRRPAPGVYLRQAGLRTCDLGRSDQRESVVYRYSFSI